MKVFDWSNSDVFSWLHQVRNRKLKPKEVSARILINYARKVSLKTIRRHVPQESLEALTVIPIITKFGGSMRAAQLGKSLFNLYWLNKKTSTRVSYKCYTCHRIRRKKEKEFAFRVPMLFECTKTGEYTINGASHHENCNGHTENEIKAKDLDRKMREEVRSDVAALPMPTWEKYENMALKESEKRGEDVTDASSLAMKFPSYEEVRYQLGRLRRDGVLNVEDPFELPEIYKNTKAKERWELISDRLNGIALFSSDRSLLVAAQCKYLAVDATFEVCPKSFRQLLTIHGLYAGVSGDEWVSLAFALMKRKEATGYKLIFDAIKNQWIRLDVKPAFRALLMDYEDSEVKAAIECFGLEKVRGCHFHFSQAVIRNVRTIGLFPMYDKQSISFNKTFNRLIQKCIALSLLPSELVLMVWSDMLKPKLKQLEVDDLEKNKIKQFATYFDLEWISKPSQLWNFYSQSVRTNNACEGFHSFLKRRPGSLRRPGYARLFHLLHTIEYQQSRRIVKLKKGVKVKPKSKIYKELNLRLNDLWVEFDSQNKKSRESIDVLSACRSFLQRAGRLVSDVGGTGLKTVKAEKVARSRKNALTDVVPSKKTKRSSIEEISIKTQKTVALLFNPPSTNFQEFICSSLGIEYRAINLFSRIFNYINPKCAKPASVLSIVGDGNCGFRALSVGLTGTQDNHGLIRKNIAEFLAEHIGENWCKLLMPDEEIRRKHVKDVRVHAKNSSDVKSYARNMDFAAASKLFQVNVLIYSTAGWRVYSPDMEIVGKSQNSKKSFHLFQ